MKLKNIILLLALGMLFACEPKVDDFTTFSGSADFAKYVAIGNSLTAGYADGDLYLSGQENSYPALLANQFEAAGGGEFTQPLMFDEYGFGKRLLLDAAKPGPVPAGVTPDPQNATSIAANGPFNNMGVPGAKSYHLIPGAEAFSAQNPYYARFAAIPGTSVVLEEAAAQNPTFFTCWIGNNDVLGYALSGGAGDNITDVNTFTYAVNTILAGMTANGAKGAIANIPNVTDIPYVQFMNTQLPYNGLVMDAEQAAGLTFAYQQFELYLASLGVTWDYPEFSAGPNPFMVSDATLPLPAPFNVRPMVQGELFLLTLPTDSLPMGMGSVNPFGENIVPWGIPSQYVLLSNELAEINQAVGAYNEIIAGLATQFNLALVDMNAKFETVATQGMEVDGIMFTTDFITGKTFSLDGVHMTAQGYSMTANFFIEAINDKYGAGLTTVSPRLYPGIYYYQ
jgi:lysophospholipase L1-like esterase